MRGWKLPSELRIVSSVLVVACATVTTAAAGSAASKSTSGTSRGRYSIPRHHLPHRSAYSTDPYAALTRVDRSLYYLSII